MDTPQLTPTQLHSLAVFSKMKAPTTQEWADRLEVSYTTAIYYRNILLRVKLLSRTVGRSRSTIVTELGHSVLNSEQS